MVTGCGAWAGRIPAHASSFSRVTSACGERSAFDQAAIEAILSGQPIGVGELGDQLAGEDNVLFFTGVDGALHRLEELFHLWLVARGRPYICDVVEPELNAGEEDAFGRFGVDLPSVHVAVAAFKALRHSTSAFLADGVGALEVLGPADGFRAVIPEGDTDLLGRSRGRRLAAVLLSAAAGIPSDGSQHG